MRMQAAQEHALSLMRILQNAYNVRYRQPPSTTPAPFTNTLYTLPLPAWCAYKRWGAGWRACDARTGARHFPLPLCWRCTTFAGSACLPRLLVSVLSWRRVYMDLPRLWFIAAPSQLDYTDIGSDASSVVSARRWLVAYRAGDGLPRFPV
jgi:hypothetical protein